MSFFSLLTPAEQVAFKTMDYEDQRYYGMSHTTTPARSQAGIAHAAGPPGFTTGPLFRLQPQTVVNVSVGDSETSLQHNAAFSLFSGDGYGSSVPNTPSYDEQAHFSSVDDDDCHCSQNSRLMLEQAALKWARLCAKEDVPDLQHPKQYVLEYAQKNMQFPKFDTSVSGPPHVPRWYCELTIGGLRWKSAAAQSKKQAEDMACRMACKALSLGPKDSLWLKFTEFVSSYGVEPPVRGLDFEKLEPLQMMHVIAFVITQL